MKPNLVWAAVFVAAALSVSALLYMTGMPSREGDLTGAKIRPVPGGKSEAPPPPDKVARGFFTPPGATGATAQTPESLTRQLAELDALAATNDPLATDKILSGLQNPNRSIRKAALETAIKLGDPSIIPQIREIASHTQDPTEKAELLAAIDYISLPSSADYLAEQRAREAARALSNSTPPARQKAAAPGKTAGSPKSIP